MEYLVIERNYEDFINSSAPRMGISEAFDDVPSDKNDDNEVPY